MGEVLVLQVVVAERGPRPAVRVERLLQPRGEARGDERPAGLGDVGVDEDEATHPVAELERGEARRDAA